MSLAPLSSGCCCAFSGFACRDEKEFSRKTKSSAPNIGAEQTLRGTTQVVPKHQLCRYIGLSRLAHRQPLQGGTDILPCQLSPAADSLQETGYPFPFHRVILFHFSCINVLYFIHA
jgi:hypothetical protein